jgi:hypothetical protein
MFDHRILFALLLTGLLALGASLVSPRNQNGSPGLSTPSAVAPIEVEPETRS